jgi:LPXTG-motif cell wall-anchored protein
VKIKKGDASTTLRDAEFSLYLANGENDSYTKDDLVQRGIKTDEDGKTTIKNLTPGTYLLVETKAPTGYLLSEKPWKIVVDLDGTVKVTYDGKTVNKTDGNYQIENAELYSLPNSGGPGTYGFTISGVAILATALLLFINNKRREEEAKRS